MKKRLRERKKLLFILLIIAIFLLSVFGTKIYLYLNLLLGNDIVVSLDVEPKTLSVMKGDIAVIESKVSVITNPFCKAQCSAQLESVSEDMILTEEIFTIRPGSSQQLEYEISPTLPGEGIALYRVNVACQGIQTVLCHTTQDPTWRETLITVNYTSNDQEIAKKEELHTKLRGAQETVLETRGVIVSLEETFAILNQTVSSLPELELFENQTTAIDLQEEEILFLWENQRYNELELELEQYLNELGTLTTLVSQDSQELLEIEQKYRNAYELLVETHQWLEVLQVSSYTNSTHVLDVSSVINHFNALNFTEKGTAQSKLDSATFVHQLANSTFSLVTGAQSKESLAQHLRNDVIKDVVCDLGGPCFAHPSLTVRANQTVSLQEACSESNTLAANLSQIHSTITLNQYPTNQSFWDEIEVKVENLQRTKRALLSQSIPVDMMHSTLLQTLLQTQAITPTVNYSNYNLTDALLYELTALPINCSLLANTLPSVKNITLPALPEKEVLNISITLPEPQPQCCIQGECQQCMVNESLYPVVILHGHAMNKDVSWQYSLDAFHELQQELEQEGYISAGAFSIYSTVDENLQWEMVPAPLSIKASYYVDLFKKPDSYSLVQTKSENIDTYAIRLKEILDTILITTGRDKVHLVAHSMGGLVSRRYVQIFGEDNVATLTMIGTPNNGVKGNVASFCDVFGEQRECKDLQAGSLFLNKLNSGNVPSIPVHVIYGFGCDGGGDGVVHVDSAQLDWAQNHQIDGTCSGLDTLHLSMLDMQRHPEVAAIVKSVVG